MYQSFAVGIAETSTCELECINVPIRKLRLAHLYKKLSLNCHADHKSFKLTPEYFQYDSTLLTTTLYSAALEVTQKNI